MGNRKISFTESISISIWHKNDNRPTSAYRCSSNDRRLGGVSPGSRPWKHGESCGLLFSTTARNQATATTVRVWCLQHSREQFSNCQHLSLSHFYILDDLRGFINAAHFSSFFTKCSVAQYCVRSLQLHTLGSKSHVHLHWITPECLDGHLRQHVVKTLRWPFFFFVLLCLGSFRSAKVGLLCNHVWLGHLLAHTNDPNWESGLRFRVTDRLTGMWGMWPGGTRLLSGPPYQLAAYCNGHLFSRLSPLFSQSQVEKKTEPTF